MAAVMAVPRNAFHNKPCMLRTHQRKPWSHLALPHLQVSFLRWVVDPGASSFSDLDALLVASQSSPGGASAGALRALGLSKGVHVHGGLTQAGTGKRRLLRCCDAGCATASLHAAHGVCRACAGAQPRPPMRTPLPLQRTCWPG